MLFSFVLLLIAIFCYGIFCVRLPHVTLAFDVFFNILLYSRISNTSNRFVICEFSVQFSTPSSNTDHTYHSRNLNLILKDKCLLLNIGRNLINDFLAISFWLKFYCLGLNKYLKIIVSEEELSRIGMRVRMLNYLLWVKWNFTLLQFSVKDEMIETVEVDFLGTCRTSKLEHMHKEEIRRRRIRVLSSTDRIELSQLWYGQLMRMGEEIWPRSSIELYTAK